MGSPHPFTTIEQGDLISITGWAPTPGFYGVVTSFPIEGRPKDNSSEKRNDFTLCHGETMVGFVVKKYKQKQKEFIRVLFKDIMITIERGQVHSASFSIGKIITK